MEIKLNLNEFIEKEKPGQVYSIGYEKRSIDELTAILNKHNIVKVIDVRRIPFSRKKGFSKSELKQHLKEKNIEYISIIELGPTKSIRENISQNRTGWSKYKKDFRKYLKTNKDRIESLIRENFTKNSCALCYERDHKRCHRSLLYPYLPYVVIPL